MAANLSTPPELQTMSAMEEDGLESVLRDQALGLISDAQTADKKDKDFLLRQVRKTDLRMRDCLMIIRVLSAKGLCGGLDQSRVSPRYGETGR